MSGFDDSVYEEKAITRTTFFCILISLSCPIKYYHK